VPRAVVCTQLGPLSGLRVEERPSQPLGPGDARIAVLAAGVNFVDALIVQGLYQIKPSTPFVPGGELVGVVTELGDQPGSTAGPAGGVAVGDRVLAMTMAGAFSTEVVFPAERLVKVPSNLTDGQAATFMQSYMTGLFALARRASLWPGRSVLVLGAGGGVGLAAVDVARALGLRVIAAASTDEKRALATARGAGAVVDSTDPVAVKVAAREFGEGGVDAVYDPVGGERAAEYLKALGENGQYLVVGFATGHIPALPANQILLANRRVIGVDMGGWFARHADDEADLRAELLGLVEAGQLSPVEPRAYPLDQVAEALAAQQGRQVAGKAVLVP